MKKIFPVVCLITFLTSCGPEPTPGNRKVTRITGGTPTSEGRYVSPTDVYCTAPGTNCGDYLPQGETPIYYKQVYADFYTKYFDDNIEGFFETNDWRTIFPTDSRINQAEVDKIINGQYKVLVMSDSSIVIFDNNINFDTENVLYAIKR